MNNREELIAKVIDIAKRNSCSINRQLSADEYQTEVWALANNAAEEVADFITEQTRLARVDEADPANSKYYVKQHDHFSKKDFDRGWNACWDAFWLARNKRVTEIVQAQLAPKPEKGNEHE